jgi:hypothetical protein
MCRLTATGVRPWPRAGGLGRDESEHLSEQAADRLAVLLAQAADVPTVLIQLIDGTGLELRVDVPAELSVLGDRSRLRQLTDNLLDNAVKFTGPGGRRGVPGVHCDLPVLPPCGYLARVVSRVDRLPGRSWDQPARGRDRPGGDQPRRSIND